MAKTKVITQGYDPATSAWYPIYDASAHAEIDDLSAAIEHIEPLTPEQQAALAKVATLYNTTITSTDGSVEVIPTTDASGNVKYDLKVSADVHVDPTTIYGDNVLTTAYYDTATKVWHVDGINHDYATTADVKNSADAITAWVENQHYLTGDGDLKDYETTAHASTAYQPKGDYATTAELEAGMETVTAWAMDTFLTGVDLSNYATTSYVAAGDDAVTAWVNNQSYLKQDDIKDFATTAYVTAGDSQVTAWAMNTFLTGVDLSDYATTAQVNALSSTVSSFEDEYKRYIASVSSDINKGAAASAWIDSFVPQNLSAGEYIDIVDSEITVTGFDTILTANNGVSAEWNETSKKWEIGLEREDVAYARYSTLAATTETAGTVTFDDLREEERYSDHVSKNTTSDAITFKPGLFHVDTKVLLTVTNPTAEYASVKLVCGSTPSRSTEIQLDCSYAHTESISLSFDVMISTEQDVAIKLENMPVNTTYALSYFNVHEIINIPALLAGTQLDVIAGDGLTKDGSEIKVNVGPGLKILNNQIIVAVGKGLKLDEGLVTGEMNIALDQESAEVVEEVQQISADLDEKVTTAYSYADITSAKDMTGYGATTGKGVLIRHLFSVPIKSPVYVLNVNATDLVTTVGVFAKQGYTQKPVIIGVYEYDPEYVHTDGTKGRTVALCDTGCVTIKSGFNEFPMVHFNSNEETEPTFKSSCLYYASIYISKDPGSGLYLATCPGYDETFNTNPQLTCDQSNIEIDLGDESKADTSFNDFGWGQGAYHELNDCPRVFMQFRNKKRV